MPQPENLSVGRADCVNCQTLRDESYFGAVYNHQYCQALAAVKSTHTPPKNSNLPTPFLQATEAQMSITAAAAVDPDILLVRGTRKGPFRQGLADAIEAIVNLAQVPNCLQAGVIRTAGASLEKMEKVSNSIKATRVDAEADLGGI